MVADGITVMNDQLKQRLMPAIVVFNLSVIATVLGQQLFGSPAAGFGAFIVRILIGAAIGAVLGGIVFAVMGRR